MKRNAPKTALSERLLDADLRASQWLADGNAAREAGDQQRADECYTKSQFWRDRYNLLAGNSDKPAPKQ